MQLFWNLLLKKIRYVVLKTPWRCTRRSRARVPPRHRPRLASVPPPCLTPVSVALGGYKVVVQSVVGIPRRGLDVRGTNRSAVRDARPSRTRALTFISCRRRGPQCPRQQCSRARPVFRAMKQLALNVVCARCGPSALPAPRRSQPRRCRAEPSPREDVGPVSGSNSWRRLGHARPARLPPRFLAGVFLCC